MTTLVLVLTLAAASCSEDDAKTQAAADEQVRAHCAGATLGCDFAARPPSPLNADEKNDRELAWVVTANQIHSFDEQKRPRFMPEGAVFARVSRACVVTRVIGHAPLPPPPK
jgi:hypothetical protein